MRASNRFDLDAPNFAFDMSLFKGGGRVDFVFSDAGARFGGSLGVLELFTIIDPASNKFDRELPNLAFAMPSFLSGEGGELPRGDLLLGRFFIAELLSRTLPSDSERFIAGGGLLRRFAVAGAGFADAALPCMSLALVVIIVDASNRFERDAPKADRDMSRFKGGGNFSFLLHRLAGGDRGETITDDLL